MTMSKNIFSGLGVRTTFVNLIYQELMKREFVTLADVMCLKRGKPKGFYDNNPKATLSRETFYGDLKKASSEVIKALEQAIPGCIESNGKTGKGKAFRYVGENDDPLAAERQATPSCYLIQAERQKAVTVISVQALNRI